MEEVVSEFEVRTQIQFQIEIESRWEEFPLSLFGKKGLKLGKRGEEEGLLKSLGEGDWILFLLRPITRPER